MELVKIFGLSLGVIAVFAILLTTPIWVPRFWDGVRNAVGSRRAAKLVRSYAYFIELGICPICASTELEDGYERSSYADIKEPKIWCTQCRNAYAVPAGVLARRLKEAVSKKLDERVELVLSDNTKPQMKRVK